MSDLLAIVQKAYDYVVLDASPLNIVSDAIIVAKQTAGVLLVIRHGSSRHDQLKKAIESCEFAEVNILGVIFNDSRTVNTNFYGYGHYKYSKDSV
jgi:Mrp family chromosome partitioning ATPase